MEYRGMSEQEAYHKGYLDGQAAMGALLKSAPIKGPTYKLSESNSLDVLTQINKSQAKEIEGLREQLKELQSGEALELALDCKAIHRDERDVTLRRWKLKSKLYQLVRLLTKPTEPDTTDKGGE